MTTEEMVRNAQLDLIVELKRICEKHQISYFLVGGTLIGAIRHNGFIPWDDDVDVGMLRDEYERFIKVCQTELDEAYALYDWQNDPASPNPFLKMKIKGTHYREKLSENTNVNDEIFIDIFPFDRAPDKAIKQKKQAWEVYLIRKILLLRCGFSIDNGSKKKKALYGLLKILSTFWSVERWKKRCSQVMKRYNHLQTQNVVNMCGAYSYKREMHPASILRNTEWHKFERLLLRVPKEYHQYLSHIYGDYMKLPPESQQKGRHEISLVDIGQYQIKYH